MRFAVCTCDRYVQADVQYRPSGPCRWRGMSKRSERVSGSQTDGPGGLLNGMPVAPSAARRQLGVELRQVRDDIGLQLAVAAKAIERSAATLSRLETAKSMPRLVDVKALLDYYAEEKPEAVPAATRERILALVEPSRETEWFTSFRDVLSSDLTDGDAQRYVEYESIARSVRSYEPVLVPGLLQTREYARAVTDIVFPDQPRRARDRFVDFRMERQRVLDPAGGSLDFKVVIDEGVLLRRIGSGKIMKAQLAALREQITDGRPNVSVQIASATASARALFGGAFLVMELRDDAQGLVYLEGREGSQFLQTPEHVERYTAMFAELSEVATDSERSARLIDEAIARLT